MATFLVSAAASSIGMFLQAAALGKQLFDITDSELALGLLGLVEFLPALILLPLTGSAADRFDRRRVAAVGLCVEVITSALFFLYAATDPTSAVPLFLIAALFGTARAFVAPSFRSLPPLARAARRPAPPDGAVRRDVAVRPHRRPGQQWLPLRRRPDGAVPRRRQVCFGVAACHRRHAAPAPAPAPHASRRAADAAPRPRGPPLHPPPSGAARRHRPRSLRRPASAVPSRCCRRSPRTASASATSATAGCAPRPASVPSP